MKVEEFFRQFTKLRCRPGEIIIRAHDQPLGVYYLKKGLVKQYLVSATKETLMIHIYRPGSFFPMTWALDNLPNSYYFETMTATELWRAPKEPVVKFLKNHPEVLFRLTNRILAGLHGVVKRMGYLVLDGAQTKTAATLLYFAKKFGTISLAHREIAAWTGTTRETVSLAIAALKRKGVIKNRGRKIIIPDIKRLEMEVAATSQARR